MAVWGIGAYYRGAKKADKTSDFIANEAAFIGWSENDAPSLHQMMKSIKIGDIIYIKSLSQKRGSPNNLIVKAIGVVTDTKKQTSASLGTGIKVLWKDNFAPFDIVLTSQIYKNNVFNETCQD